jgi:hypothetical protein
MKLIHRILLVLTLVTTLPAGELVQGDRTTLLNHLDQSSAEFLNSVRGLTAEQWNYKPAGGGWSIAECAVHIALSEDFLRGIVENKVLTAPASPERIAERKSRDERVLHMITDRSFKAQAPAPLIPAAQFPTPQAALDKFQESRRKTIALARSRNDLREHAGPHPAFKEIDGYQWLLYISGHTMRHTAQIMEVRADSGFPKGR